MFPNTMEPSSTKSSAAWLSYVTRGGNASYFGTSLQLSQHASQPNFSVEHVEIVFTARGDVMGMLIVLMPQMKMVVVS